MSISVCKRIKKYPRGAGDIGDIGDIFRKSLKLLDFLQVHPGDIPGDIFGDGDKSPSSPPCATPEVFPKRKRSVAIKLSLRAFPPFAKKKSLTARDKSASNRVSLSTDSAFFAAGCCDCPCTSSGY